MDYDLAADAAEVRALLGDAVEAYLRGRARAPGEHPPVRRVELSFLPGDGRAEPTLRVHFDTHPGSALDGDADFQRVAEVSRPQWMPLLFEDSGQPLRATFPDGSVHVAPTEAAPDVLASFMFETMQSARREGAFDRVAGRGTLRLSLTYQGTPLCEDPMPDE